MTTTNDITIEDIEALATQLENEDETTRAKLRRMIRAHARIVWVREPKSYQYMAVEFADEDGHWDNSFPPKQEYRDYSGPRLLKVENYSWGQHATSSGYYHEWRASTEKRGVFVDRRGELWGAEVSGTGRVGRYAAHPGDCGVLLSIEWSQLDEDEVSTEALRTVERVMRSKAFPLAAPLK